MKNKEVTTYHQKWYRHNIRHIPVVYKIQLEMHSRPLKVTEPT